MRICGNEIVVQFVEMNFNGYLCVKGKNGNFFRKYKSSSIEKMQEQGTSFCFGIIIQIKFVRSIARKIINFVKRGFIESIFFCLSRLVTVYFVFIL